jgi:large repetitive protein
VLANDNDLNEYDEITVDVSTPPSHGSVDLDPKDGSFTYIPDPGFFGEDSFVYTLIALPPGLRGEYTDTATVYITVNPKCILFMPLLFNE